MTQKNKAYTVGEPVTVDGIDGFIAAVHPLGNGKYVGTHHAYYWVSTPGLDYTNYHLGTTNAPVRKVLTGRAVSFVDADRRLRKNSSCNIPT